MIPSSICSLGMRPHLVTGFLRQLFAQHFADPSNINNPFLRAKLEDLGPWIEEASDGSGEKSGIQIESSTRWKPDTMEQRPAIIIKRNSWRWVRKIIDSRMMGDNTPDQFERYLGWWHGSHTIFAIADEGGEAENLGTEVAMLVVHYHSQIRDALNLDRFIPVEVSELVEIEEATENFAVPITVAYIGQEPWTMLQNVPRLKRIDIKASYLLRC